MAWWTGRSTRQSKLLNSCVNCFFNYVDVYFACSVCRYEEVCRNILGNKSYLLYNLDKVVQQSVKCLQAMASDEVTSKMIGIFMYHRSLNIAGGTCADLYRLHVATCLNRTLEEVYCMQVCEMEWR